MNRILLTGGAGFIGSQFARHALAEGAEVIILDSLTYAGHRENLTDIEGNSRFQFFNGDIRDGELVGKILSDHSVTSLVHMAAESHVDNSITGPLNFLETNILGTYSLLEATRKYLQTKPALKSSFRFLHVSTDEVFGSLKEADPAFTEQTAYDPRSPYSSSKASSDHLVRAWAHTYDVPAIVTNCSNNYGPRQFPEKLIPVMIRSAAADRSLPVYGDGSNIRDWIHVEDHCRGVWLALTKGRVGETYCLGGRSERSNLQVVKALCSIMDELRPLADKSHASNIRFVTDRPGHDWRYAINSAKAESELGFVPKHTSFESGLRETVEWYLSNEAWVHAVCSKGAKS